MLRVISGIKKGYKLDIPNSSITRPTKDRVRESVFSMILFEIEGAKILDLFAGSGSMGIEALSRGASHCDFVDNNSDAIAILKKNLQHTHFDNFSNIYCDNYEEFLACTKQKYDIILLDPPYKLDLIDEILDIITQRDLITEKGLVIYEFNIKTDNHDIENCHFELYKNKKYGKTGIIVLRRNL